MIKVYGASDDLIEVRGELREEFGGFSASDDQPAYLAFSDGTVLAVWYSAAAGEWKIKREHAGTATFSHMTAECHADEDAPNYSDVVTLDNPGNGGFAWMTAGEDLLKVVPASAS